MNAQNKIRVGFDKGCHLYNSSVLQDIVHETISKEDLINIISNKINLSETSLVKNDFMNIFKIHIVYNHLGKIVDIVFIESRDNKLDNKHFKSIKRSIKKRKENFKLCFNDLANISKLSQTEIEKNGMIKTIELATKKENCVMSIYYPGFIDERFLENIK